MKPSARALQVEPNGISFPQKSQGWVLQSWRQFKKIKKGQVFQWNRVGSGSWEIVQRKDRYEEEQGQVTERGKVRFRSNKRAE